MTNEWNGICKAPLVMPGTYGNSINVDIVINRRREGRNIQRCRVGISKERTVVKGEGGVRTQVKMLVVGGIIRRVNGARGRKGKFECIWCL